MQPVLKAMQNGATIITPNNRLSDALLHQYLQASTHTTRPKPACFAYPAFLRETFKKLTQKTPSTVHPRLLSDAHIQALWRHILDNTENAEPQQNLINTLQQAFVMCTHWQLSCPHQAFQSTPQTKQFETYRINFLNALQKRHAITEYQLSDYFIAHLNTQPTERILWVCFDDYTPAQKAFQAHLSALGVIQEHIELEGETPVSYQVIASDKIDEYARITQFIQTALKQKTKRIGIIVPNLHEEAAPLERYLKRHIDASQFSFSLGKPLADYPFIAHALQWLKLNLFEISHHDIQLLLNSPYLVGATKEWHARIATLQHLPLLQERALLFKTFKQALKDKTPLLFDALNALTPYPKKASMRHWATLFLNRLKTLGFPGEKPLQSIQYQCFERFIGLFDTFISLAVIQPEMTAKEALTAFQDIAKACIFQPEKADTPVTILGLLEASGCPFDAVWMADVTHQNLPSKVHFNAFIPITLQREMCMPYADAKREYLLAEKRIHRLKKVADTLVFSYPALVNDIPTLPSPLIGTLPEYPSPPLTKKSHSALITERETYHLPFAPCDTPTGGSTRLTQQALCPFQAFAAHRLHATEYPALVDGLDASTRGQVVHRVLEALWRTLKTQKKLLAYQETELQIAVEQLIEKALKPLKQQRPHSFPKLIQSIELKRLKRLIYAALDWDKSRPAFAIEALEKRFTLTLGKLEFRIQLDRLDLLETGEKWLIDYKSRIPSPLPFHEERPDAPQLLLYALLDNAIRGLLFIELKKGHVTCCGFAEDAYLVDGIKALSQDENWLTYQQLWHQRLTELSDEFYRGHCPPAPKKSSTCQTCNFHALCRIPT
ncbi:MAG: PD-(D/E)XK nuclease family protein [Legionellaceae bacterium]|nr:PD-(D/E)XK nuclease family protein [Legionellaceae bacterium]